MYFVFYILDSLIEREPLILNNFNLKVGSPYSLEIDACNSESLYIEVYYAKSIIYIAFALENKDISFEILKYENDDHFNSVDNESDDKDNRKFKSILRLDYIEHSSSPIKVHFQLIISLLYLFPSLVFIRLYGITHIHGSQKRKFDIEFLS